MLQSNTKKTTNSSFFRNFLYLGLFFSLLFFNSSLDQVKILADNQINPSQDLSSSNSSQSQSSSQSSISTSSIPAGSQSIPTSPKEIDNQAQVIETKRQDKEQISENITELEKQNSSLQARITDLKTELTSLKAELEDANLDPVSNQGRIVEIGNRISELENSLIPTAERAITQNQETLNQLNTELNVKETELQEDINVFQNQVIQLVIQVGSYIGILLAYWLIYRFLIYIFRRIIKNSTFFGVVRLILTIILFLGSFVTILLAFSGNLQLIASGVGLLSAALVVALQDFVSSFFAWIWISTKNHYKPGDLIEIKHSGNSIYGEVLEVGAFKTNVKQNFGSEGIDKELFTGRIISFPNNTILKEPLTNFTRENKILWHSLDLVITFESDLEKAKKIMQHLLNSYFVKALKSKTYYLDNVRNLEDYRPKLYLSIADNGPRLTIWFASRAGRFREILDEFSQEILSKFNKEENIVLAYKTSRLYKEDSDLVREKRILKD